MNKKKHYIFIATVLLVVCWLLVYSVLTSRSSVQAGSPDGRYVAEVSSIFPLFGDYRYNIKVRESDGQAIRHLTIRDKIYGWPRDPSVKWSANSKTVIIGLEDGDTDGPPRDACKRLYIDVQ